MADLASAAAALRPPMAGVDKLMTIFGVTPPQQWTDLKDTVAPATVTQIQNAQSATESAWNQVGTGLHTASADLTGAARTIDHAAQGRAGPALSGVAQQAAGNFATMDVLCGWVKEADQDRHAALVTMVEAAVVTVVDFLAVVVAGFVAGAAASPVGIVAGIVGVAVSVSLFAPLFKWLINAYDKYEAAVDRYNQLLADATRYGARCEWNTGGTTPIPPIPF